MKKYPSVEQLRNVVRAVIAKHDYQGVDENGETIYEHKGNYPTLKFQGTVKLHGTNAAIVKYSDGHVEYQSRERELTYLSDNAGFRTEMLHKNVHNLLIDFLFSRFSCTEYIAIYGEWCGGNIQKGVAISGLEKMFVIFGIKIDDIWIDLPADLHSNENGIYNILQFPTYEIDIDFNQPELIQNKLIEMTIAVEECCPVGKFFGVEGIGEGIVFTCITNPEFRFKSKGEKHSSSKVKVLNTIDTEMVESINEFVNFAVTENRLNQGISYFKENGIEVDSKNTGQFLQWIVGDVLKEELDTLEKSGLDGKKVKRAIVAKARIWFFF